MVKFIVSGTFEAPRTGLFKRAFRRVDLPEFMTPLAAMLKSVSFDLFLAAASASKNVLSLSHLKSLGFYGSDLLAWYEKF